jgi:PAS domain S-box-containing protein
MQLTVNKSFSEIGVFQPAQILVVEDESIIAFNLQETLESIGYFVIGIAISADQAIRSVEELHPDLVLMDIRLKGEKDGIQAAEEIWDRFQVPVIYVTGHSDKSTVERAKLTAPFGYLIKPIKEKELYVAIESALQRCEREQWMSRVLKGIGDGVIVADMHGTVKFLNPVAETLTDWRLDDAREQPLSRVFNIVDESTGLSVEHLFNVVLEQGMICHLEGNILLIAKNGKSLPIADSISPLKDSDGSVTGMVIVFQDITTRRQAEERNRAVEWAQLLEQQMEELEHLSQLKDDFLSTVSHELRTPLANVKMAIQMLELVLDQQGLLSPENNTNYRSLARYMEILRSQCNQELNLVNDLLDLQRLNANRYLLELSSIRLQDWIPYMLDSFKERLQERQLDFCCDIAPDLPPLESDLPSLNRIFIELLNNACKYTPPREKIYLTVKLIDHPTFQIEESPPISPETEIPTVSIDVCNTGVEIPPEEIPRIFEPFYRIPKIDKWSQGGTGLGLSLVQKLVDFLNGSITVKSGSGQTCVSVELPYRQP